MNYSNFLGSESYDFNAASCSDPSTIISAENNFWVDIDSVTIADEHILDHSDDSQAPTVDFVPFLVEQLSAGVEGIVSDEDSNPVEGVEVEVLGTPLSGYTGADGHYFVGGLETGYYDIAFSHPDYRDTTVAGLFVLINNNSILDMILQVPCPYVLGDYNGSGEFNVSDVIDSFSKLKLGYPLPALLCECPTGSNEWAVAMDVNNTCEFNIADVITAFSKLKTGSPDLIPCELCPPLP